MKTRSKGAKKAGIKKGTEVEKEEDGWKKLTPELLSRIFENIDLYERHVPAFYLKACKF